MLSAKRLLILLALLWSVIAFVIFWQYDLVQRKLDADASFMLYAGQQILRGHAPYVGVGVVKLPVSPLVAAAGIGAGRLVGLDDILAGRLAFALCAAVTVGAVFVLGARVTQVVGDASSDPSPTLPLVMGGGFDPSPALPLVRGGSFDPTPSPLTQGVGGASSDPSPALPLLRGGGGDLSSILPLARGGSDSPNVLALLAGSFAATVLLSFQALGVQVAEGPEAKLPMICAGVICLALLSYRRLFLAGLAGVLSFMAWQPGLIFVVAAFLCALVVPPRGRSLIRTLAGVAIPPVLIGAYLALNGAFASMLRQAFGANANYLGEKKVAVGVLGVVVGNVAKVWDISLTCSATETPFVALSFIGLFSGGAFLLWRLWKTRDGQLFTSGGPLLLSGAALFAFSLLDLQACSDVVPLLPYLALGAAFVLTVVTIFVARLIARASVPSNKFDGKTMAPQKNIAENPNGETTTRQQNTAENPNGETTTRQKNIAENPYGETTQQNDKIRQQNRTGKEKHGERLMLIIGCLLLALVFAYGASDAFRVPRQNRLDQQRALARSLEAQLQPGDRVQQFGDTVFLVVTRRENATRFVHLGEKQGLGILTAEGISIENLVQQLDAANPRIITLSRAKTKEWAAPLYRWIESEYTLQTSYSGGEGGTQKETDVWWRRER